MSKACTKPRRLVAKLEPTGRLGLGPVLGPEDAVKVVDKMIGERAYETFVALYLNTSNCVFAFEEFTSGGINQVYIVPSAVVRDALLAGAVGVITVHQHPSGSVKPSADDERLWKELRTQLDVFGIKLLDNFIIGLDRYYSQELGQEQAK